MRRTRALRWTLALVVLLTFQMPVGAEDFCADTQDLRLLYHPDEPPPCPAPPRAFVPSTIGRPHDATAWVLATCAGLIDAALLIEPELRDDPEFIDGDMYFARAMARRERPGLSELEDRRQSARDWLLDDFRDDTYSLGSLVPHSFYNCAPTYLYASNVP